MPEKEYRTEELCYVAEGRTLTIACLVPVENSQREHALSMLETVEATEES